MKKLLLTLLFLSTTVAYSATYMEHSNGATSTVVDSTANPAQGQTGNLKLSVTVASNDLIVALKGTDGNDPSASNPVYVRIGDTVRTVTSALSVTAADATNWCNAGSAELATLEIDYFVYLGYNATDGVVIGFSRFPGASSYGEFSATSTNEKFCKISTITTAASTDYYEVVGRFAATLSAGAGYTWTVPTFTAINLLNRPIYESRWLSFAPNIGVASGTTPQYSTFTNKYKMKRDTVMIVCKWSGDGGNEGNGTNPIIGTLPFAAGSYYSQNRGYFGYGLNLNNTTAHSTYANVDATNSTFTTMNEGTTTLTGTLQNHATRFNIFQGEYEI